MSANHKDSNASKSAAGYTNKSELLQICKSLQDDGLITKIIEKNYRVPHKGFKIPQYKADLVLKDNDDAYFLIYTSNSFRSDRIKTTDWDCFGVLTQSDISHKIVASIFIIPDEQASDSFTKYREEIKKKEKFSPLTHFFLQSEFVEFMEQWATDKKLKAESIELIQQSAVQVKAPSPNTLDALFPVLTNVQPAHNGVETDKRGRNFEAQLAKILEDPLVLSFIKNRKIRLFNNEIAQTFVETLLDTSLDYLHIKPHEVTKLQTTTQIKLPSHGAAKTDLALYVYTDTGEKGLITFSLKISTQSSVSCHQYPPKEYLRVLEQTPLNEETKNLLKEGISLFGKTGSWSEIEKRPKEWQKKFFQSLSTFIHSYLAKWAISGEIYNENSPPEAIASHIILFNPLTQKFYISSCDKYIDRLINDYGASKSNPFTWTYKNIKRTGFKDIQLKLKLKYD